MNIKKVSSFVVIILAMAVIAALLVPVVGHSTTAPAQVKEENKVVVVTTELTTEPTDAPATTAEPAEEETVTFGSLILRSMSSVEVAEEMAFGPIFSHLVAINSQAVPFVDETDDRLVDGVDASEAFIAEFSAKGEIPWLRANGKVVGLYEDDTLTISTAKVSGTAGADVVDWFRKGTSGWVLTETRTSRVTFEEDVAGTLSSTERSPFTVEGATRFGGAVRLLKVDDTHYVWVIVTTTGATTTTSATNGEPSAPVVTPAPTAAPTDAHSTPRPTTEVDAHSTPRPTSAPTDAHSTPAPTTAATETASPSQPSADDYDIRENVVIETAGTDAHTPVSGGGSASTSTAATETVDIRRNVTVEVGTSTGTGTTGSTAAYSAPRQ